MCTQIRVGGASFEYRRRPQRRWASVGGQNSVVVMELRRREAMLRLHDRAVILLFQREPTGDRRERQPEADQGQRQSPEHAAGGRTAPVSIPDRKFHAIGGTHHLQHRASGRIIVWLPGETHRALPQSDYRSYVPADAAAIPAEPNVGTLTVILQQEASPPNQGAHLPGVTSTCRSRTLPRQLRPVCLRFITGVWFRLPPDSTPPTYC